MLKHQKKTLIAIQLVIALLIALHFGCGVGANYKNTAPVVDEKPPVSGSFIDIANNPEANKSQIYFIALLKGLVGEDNTELAFEKLMKLKKIKFRNKGIVDISAISDFTNLETLILSDNHITDITPLQSLTNLTTLEFNSNKISNIAALGSLTNLARLVLTDNLINDITSFENLTKLTTVHINSNKISNITALEGLVNLEELHIIAKEGSALDDFSVLPKLKKLKYLSIDVLEPNYGQLSTALINCNSLETLMLVADINVNFSNLINVKSLKNLGIKKSAELDAAQLKDFINLENLIYSNSISNTEALDHLKTQHANSDGKIIFLKIIKGFVY